MGCVAGIAGIHRQRRAVGEHREGGIAAAGGDLVDVERAWRPQREQLARCGGRLLCGRRD
jgi:hypothetical protein